MFKKQLLSSCVTGLLKHVQTSLRLRRVPTQQGKETHRVLVHIVGIIGVTTDMINRCQDVIKVLQQHGTRGIIATMPDILSGTSSCTGCAQHVEPQLDVTQMADCDFVDETLSKR